jgi:hypothetical protein
MNTLFKAGILGLAVAALTACTPDPQSSIGFTLPEGNVEQGKSAYIAMGCNSCHQHSEVPQVETPVAGDIAIVLGGETARVRTYGELVTSVINPSHRIARRGSAEVTDASGESRMLTFNDVMTVTQLIDIVAFLQQSYELSPYRTTVYPVYWQPESKDG